MAVEKKRKADNLQPESGASGEADDVVVKKPKLNQVHKTSDSRDAKVIDRAREEPLVNGKSRKRHRKKKLYDDLCQLMEFYFGDSNLSKSKFMNEEMSKIEGGWIDLEVFLRFNKLAEMMKNYFEKLDIEDLWNALSFRLNRAKENKDNSPSLLEIRTTEAGAKQIRRCTPLVAKATENVEKCTVYIENLPPYVTNDSLKKLFNDKYGPVDYVSLPRYKHNRAVKGFAFIEFANISGAEAAIKAFEGEKASTGECENTKIDEKQRIKPENADPAELQSVKSFQEEQAIEHGLIIPATDDQTKESSKESTDNKDDLSITVEGDKELKNEIRSDDKKDESNGKSSNNGKLDEKCSDSDGGGEENKEIQTSKKRRKRNKNRNAQVNLPPQQSTYMTGPDGNINHFVPMDVGSHDDYVLSVLRIMKKEEWRKMRNKYLNLQKQNMSAAKGRIRQMRNYPKEKIKENQQATVQSHSTDALLENDPSTTDEGLNKSKIEFVPGTIVKFVIDEPIIDQGKQVKSRIRAAVMEPVKYVDAANGSSKVFVRCSNQKQAEVISAAKNLLGTNSGEILTGNEESEYWEKIQSDRQDKISGKVKVKPSFKKERGKDRIVKQYEHAIRNTHKFFDEGE